MRKLRPADPGPLRASIAQRSHASCELRCLHRLHAVLLVSLGCSCYEVAHWFGEDPRSVERWVHAYETAGVDGLSDHPGGGRPAALPALLRDRLRTELHADPRRAGHAQAHWTGKLLARHLAVAYGVQLSVRQCQRLLLQLGAAAPPQPG